MKIGYMRVSTPEQSFALQEEALKAAGCERLYQDAITGKGKKREGLEHALDALRAGDTLVVWKLDRLARSLKHLTELINQLRTCDIDLHVLTQNIDTRTPAGRMMFGIFATIAEFEHDLIKERTMAGLAAARARGRKGGRPRKMTVRKLKTARTLLAQGDLSASEVARELGVSRSTLYCYINAEGALTPAGEEILA